MKLSEISKDENSMPIFTDSSGKKFGINELSSGEKQLFLRTLAIKILEPENSIIMIDEPELSLHPKWQQKIVDVYRKIGRNNQIILATHSPHILGSVEKENIILLEKNENGIVEVKTGDEFGNSYGQTTGRILEDIMGLETDRNPSVYELLNQIKEMVKNDNYESFEFERKYRTCFSTNKRCKSAVRKRNQFCFGCCCYKICRRTDSGGFASARCASYW